MSEKPIQQQSFQELKERAREIREKILQTVSKNGGHLGSALGAVELIIAMHYVFDVKKDPFIYDVSHQAYAHKLLTDRWDSFDTLRRFGGISGFIKPSESPYDYFGAGHSSTSISVALGAAKAINLKKENRIPVVLIGDGSMSAGMVYEALNELGDRKYPVVIILNDNEMSISQPIGAVSKYLSKALAGEVFQGIKKRIDRAIAKSESVTYLAKRFEESLKLITPGILFEELGLDYIGPIDGHNIEELISTLKIAKRLKHPVIVHTQTTKGKGYEIAEGKYEHWHGVGPFDIKSGEFRKSTQKRSPTKVFSETLLELADSDEKIVGVTAAMPSGTGVDKLIEKYPDRFWDVAIAEQHAVTSMAALAKEGFKPFVVIYSTFLQRAYDQIIHDVAIQELPVKFAIDRAGVVGEDGETHQGVFDVAFFRIIPNIVMFAPRDNATLKEAVRFAAKCNKPCAFRYPRNSFLETTELPSTPFELGKSELLKEGEDMLFIGYGNGVNRAWATDIKGRFNAAVLDLRFLVPLDRDMLLELASRYKRWFVFSDNVKAGGVASALREFFDSNSFQTVPTIRSLEFPDIFITHGATKEVEQSIGQDIDSLVKKIENLLI